MSDLLREVVSESEEKSLFIRYTTWLGDDSTRQGENQGENHNSAVADEKKIPV